MKAILKCAGTRFFTWPQNLEQNYAIYVMNKIYVFWVLIFNYTTGKSIIIDYRAHAKEKYFMEVVKCIKNKFH